MKAKAGERLDFGVAVVIENGHVYQAWPNSYEHKRNKLIVKAEFFADRAAKDRRNFRDGEEATARWNRLYHGEMKRLVKEAKL